MIHISDTSRDCVGAETGLPEATVAAARAERASLENILLELCE